MPNEFVIKITGGNFVNEGELHEAVERVLGPSIKKAALVLQAGIQQAAPVVTGNLRRSAYTADPEWQGSSLVSGTGMGAIYAHRVDTVGKSAGYVKRGIDASKEHAKDVLKEGLHELAAALWVKGGIL